MKLQVTSRALVGALALAFGASAQAGVSADEAARLKTDLTPLGGERAGNKEGTIPAWTGGYTTPQPGDKPGKRRGDPFNDDKPLYSITAKNADQYAERLSEGTKALLKAHPDTWRLDVYPTRRTAAAPQWVYDNTLKNATRGKMNGDIPDGVFGGVPFPIPKTGAEVIWNHILRWRGETTILPGTQYLITADGKAVLTFDGYLDVQMPYYFKDSSLEEFQKTNDFWFSRVNTAGPPIRAGESISGRANLDGSKNAAWVYLTGQRRIRKLPNPCCDVPTPLSAGVANFDEVYTWDGRTDRFDWKLVGKKEMIVPYNGNRLLQPKTDAEVIGQAFLKPEVMRWELHRVWIVDAALRAGQRHTAPKSRYYCDEDSWICVLGERWDGNGQLWKSVWTYPFVAPDLPGVIAGSFGFNDLVTGTAFIANLYNTKEVQNGVVPRFPDAVYSPDALAGAGVR